MVSDLRHGLRILFTAPAFSALVIVILAVGIGATSTIFSVVHAVLLRPLPFAEPARLVDVASIVRGDEDDGSSYLDVKDWAQAKTVTGLAGYFATSLTLTGRGPAQSLQVSGTTSNLFSVLGASPELGRTLSADDERTKADVVVLSEGAWARLFNRSPSVIGERLVLDARALTIVGVMPDAFDFPIQGDRVQAWVPLTAIDLSARFADQRAAHFLNVVGRLAPGATLAELDAELATISKRLAVDYPQSNSARTARAFPLQQRLVGDYQLALLVLIGAVGVVLLIACVNVANLLLVRGTGRQREMAIRSAVGAPRSRLVRQLLVESLVLSVTAGVVGVIVADWSLFALTTSLPFDMPRIHEARIDRPVLLFLTGVSIVTGIVFGMAPALQLSSASAGDALKETAHAAAGGRSARTRQALMIAEVALSLVLLATAGLLIRSFVSLQHVDAGFVPEHAVGAGMMLPESRYPDDSSRIAFARRLVDTVQQIPGVSAAAISTTLPLTGSTLDVGFDIEGQPQPLGSRRSAIYFAVSPDYFKAMGIRLLKGRSFTEHDDERSPNVVIVGETMARRYWPAGDAIGKRLTIGYNNTGPREVVGIVADVKNESLSDPAGLTMYTPFPQTPWPVLGIVARSDNNPAGTVRALTTTLSKFAPDLPADDVQVLSTFVARTTATPRFLTASVAGFAGFALLLAGCGLFSVLAYSVAQRRREIGIRMALGAGAADVGRHIVGQALRLGAIGLGIGLMGALAAGQVLRELLFNVSPSDPLTLVGVITTLGAIVLIAAYIPARRAIRIDPAKVLRAD